MIVISTFICLLSFRLEKCTPAAPSMDIEFDNTIKDEEQPPVKSESYIMRMHDVDRMDDQSLEEVNANEEDEFKREKQEYGEGGTVDLNTVLLDGLVRLCWAQGLIDQEKAHSFLHNHSQAIDRRFIELYREGRLDQLDFSQCKIHVIDHRRMVHMLIEHNPTKYLPLSVPQEPYDWNPEVRAFLKELYSMELHNYQTILERQASQYYQYWWGGPRFISPVVDPPVRFSETEEGKKLREDKENTIRIESHEEQKERTRRVNQQRATTSDLMDIAKLISNKIYGAKPSEPLPKLEIADDSASQSGAASSKSEKNKKSKKGKKEKKDKKSKKKKGKKEKQIKQENNQQPTEEPSNVKQEDGVSQASSKKSSKSSKRKKKAK